MVTRKDFNRMMSLPTKKDILHTYVEVHFENEYTRAYVIGVMPQAQAMEVRWEATEDTGWVETISTLTLEHHWVGMHVDQTTPFKNKKPKSTKKRKKKK